LITLLWLAAAAVVVIVVEEVRRGQGAVLVVAELAVLEQQHLFQLLKGQPIL
jgi:hypothetical protein